MAAEGAQIHEDLFVGGGGLDAPVGFAPRRPIRRDRHRSALGARLRAIVPWLTRGLLLGPSRSCRGLSWVVDRSRSSSS